MILGSLNVELLVLERGCVTTLSMDIDKCAKGVKDKRTVTIKMKTYLVS